VYKKKEEREAAMRVIRENQEEKRKRMQDIENARLKDAADVERNMKEQEEKDKKREEQIKQRGARIQAMMDKMADVVDNRDKEMQLK